MRPKEIPNGQRHHMGESPCGRFNNGWGWFRTTIARRGGTSDELYQPCVHCLEDAEAKRAWAQLQQATIAKASP